jgi:type I restriction enzyme S subunit
MRFDYTKLSTKKFDLPANWNVVKVKDVARINELSITQKVEMKMIEYIDIDSVENGRILNVQHLALTSAPTRARRIVRNNDILISTVRPNLKHFAFIKNAKQNTIASTGFAVITAYKVNPRFLYYYLTSKPFTTYLTQIAETSTSAYPSFTPDVIENAELLLPPPLEQNEIAEILGSLDDKIELNYEINKTLEAIAQAIFKNWFVDFEPFKDELVYNEELDKEIPRGWEVVELKEILSLEYGEGLPERERIPGNIPVYGSNGIVGWHNKALVRGPGIVVGRKGTAGSVQWSHTDFYPIDTTFYVIPKEKVRSMIYLYFMLLHQNLPKLVADSAVPGLNRNIVYLNKTVLPPRDLIKQFDNLVTPLFEMIHIKTQEGRILEQIRDTLLPKLLSGEIRVKVDVEKEFPEQVKKLEEIGKEKVKLQGSLDKWLK